MAGIDQSKAGTGASKRDDTEQSKSFPARLWSWLQAAPALPFFEEGRKLAINLVVIVLVALSVAVVGKAVFKSGYVFEEIHAPEEIVKRGYTGPVLAHRIRDEIQKIGRSAHTSKDRGEIFGSEVEGAQGSISATKSQLEGMLDKIQLPVAGMSLATIVNSLREFFGISDIVISGEVVRTNQPADGETGFYSLSIRVSDQGSFLSAPQPADKFDSLFHEVALKAVERLDPYVAAAYYSARHDRENAHRMANICLTNATEDDDKWAYNLRAGLAREEKRYDFAISEYEKLNQRYPDFPLSRYNLALAYIDKGTADKAPEYFEKAVKIADAGIALETNLQRKSVGYNNAGLALERLKSKDKAAAYYRDSIKANPKSAFAYLNLERITRSHADPDESVRLFRAAVAVDPTSASAYRRWAYFLDEIKRHDEATERFEKAISLEPSEAEKSFYTAELKLRSNDPHKTQEAVADIRKAIEKGVKESKYHYTLGRTLRRLKQFDDANKAFEHVIALDPNHAWAYANWGRSLAESLATLSTDPERERQRGFAAEKSRTAAGKAPENADVLIWVGGTYAMLTMPQQAVEAYEAAITADPSKRGEIRPKIAELRERLTLQ